MIRIPYSAPGIDIVDLCAAQVIASSYNDGGEGLKYDNKWGDITFFVED